MTDEEMIRKGFNNHRARYRSAWFPGYDSDDEGKLVCELEWSENGEGRNNVIRFFSLRNMLLVQGNYGVAVYCTTDEHSIEWWSDTDLGYFWEHCRATKHDLGRIGAEIPADVRVHWIALQMALKDVNG